MHEVKVLHAWDIWSTNPKIIGVSLRSWHHLYSSFNIADEVLSVLRFDF